MGGIDPPLNFHGGVVQATLLQIWCITLVCMAYCYKMRFGLLQNGIHARKNNCYRMKIRFFMMDFGHEKTIATKC